MDSNVRSNNLHGPTSSIAWGRKVRIQKPGYISLKIFKSITFFETWSTNTCNTSNWNSSLLCLRVWMSKVINSLNHNQRHFMTSDSNNLFFSPEDALPFYGITAERIGRNLCLTIFVDLPCLILARTSWHQNHRKARRHVTSLRLVSICS